MSGLTGIAAWLLDRGPVEATFALIGWGSAFFFGTWPIWKLITRAGRPKKDQR